MPLLRSLEFLRVWFLQRCRAYGATDPRGGSGRILKGFKPSAQGLEQRDYPGETRIEKSLWDSGRGIDAASRCDVPGRVEESDAVCRAHGEAAWVRLCAAPQQHRPAGTFPVATTFPASLSSVQMPCPASNPTAPKKPPPIPASSRCPSASGSSRRINPVGQRCCDVPAPTARNR